MIKSDSKTALATGTPVGNISDITGLAARAGLPYQATISHGLAEKCRHNQDAPLNECLEVFDLVWATRAAITGCLPVRKAQVDHDCVRYFLEFASYRSNPKTPDECVVVAELNTAHEPGRLHLHLPGEHAVAVLVVEDDPDLGNLICSVLEENGFRSIIARTGRDAFRFAQTDSPDIISLDIDLPDVSGFEVFQQLRAQANTCSIPIVFCSGRADVECRALELGAQGWLRKPDDLAKLPQHLRRILSCA